MISIVDWTPTSALVLILFISVISSIIYTIYKRNSIGGTVSYRDVVFRYIILIVVSVSSLFLGAKLMRGCWLVDNDRLNHQLEQVMNRTDKVNTDVVVRENQKVVARENQRVRVITKVERISGNEFKDYYSAINEAADNPNRQ